MNKAINAAYLVLLALGLLIAPLGGELAELSFHALCALLFLSLAFRKNSPVAWRCSRPGAAPLLALSLYALLQLIPLPPSALEFLVPRTADLYRDGIWALQPGAWMPISAHPRSTLLMFSRFFSLSVFYLITLQVLGRRDRLKNVAFFTSLMLALGAIFSLYPNPALRNAGSAGLLAVGFPAVLMLYLAVRPRNDYLTWRQRFVELFRRPEAYPHLPLGIGTLLVGAGALLGAPPDLLLGGAAGAFLAGLLLYYREKRLKKALLLFGAAMTGVLGWVVGVLLLQTGAGEGNPLSLEGKGIEMLMAAMPLGAGFGTADLFQDRFLDPGGAPAAFRDTLAGFLIGGGIPGVFIGAWFFASLLCGVLPRWQQRKNRLSTYLPIGCLGAMTASLVAMLWQNRSLTFAMLVFLALLAGVFVMAALVPSEENREVPCPLPASPLRWLSIPLAAAAVLQLAMTAGVIGGRALSASPRAGLQMASRIDPLEDAYRFRLGRAGGGASVAELDADLRMALRLNPLSGEYLQEIGSVLSLLGENRKGEELLRTGLEYDPSAPRRYRRYVDWLFSQGRVSDGLERIRQILKRCPEETPFYLSLLVQYDIGIGELERVLPPRALAHLEFGEFLLSEERSAAAEDAFSQAIRHIDHGGEGDLEAIWRISRYFANDGRFQEALEVAQRGLEAFPREAELRLWAVRLYENLGMMVKAEEERQKMKLLDARDANRHEKSRERKI